MVVVRSCSHAYEIGGIYGERTGLECFKKPEIRVFSVDDPVPRIEDCTS